MLKTCWLAVLLKHTLCSSMTAYGADYCINAVPLPQLSSIIDAIIKPAASSAQLQADLGNELALLTCALGEALGLQVSWGKVWTSPCCS